MRGLASNFTLSPLPLPRRPLLRQPDNQTDNDMRMLFSRALLPLTLSLNPLVSIAARTSRQSPNLKAVAAFSPQCLPYTTMSENNQTEQPQAQSQEQQQQERLALPDANSASNAPQIDLSQNGGQSVKLDHLGPMVVNTDGTMSRISNWEHMTEMEKQNTLRVLGKRNKQRLDALKASST